MNKDDCKELKNIKFQTMMSSSNTTETDTKKSKTDVDKLLKEESDKNKKEQWSKLDKTDKIKKVNEYISKTLKEEMQLSNSEIGDLKKYMTNCIDKKRLKNTDIQYDKESGLIKKIPSLVCNKLNRRFTLKREKKISTLKSLAPKKSKTKRKSPTKKED